MTAVRLARTGITVFVIGVTRMISNLILMTSLMLVPAITSHQAPGTENLGPQVNHATLHHHHHRHRHHHQGQVKQHHNSGYADHGPRPRNPPGRRLTTTTGCRPGSAASSSRPTPPWTIPRSTTARKSWTWPAGIRRRRRRRRRRVLPVVNSAPASSLGMVWDALGVRG